MSSTIILGNNGIKLLNIGSLGLWSMCFIVKLGSGCFFYSSVNSLNGCVSPVSI